MKQELINNEISKKVKIYSINRSNLNTYYNVGKMLSEAGKHYGEGIIKEYSKKLTNELGKGYTFTSLTRIKKFYNLIEKLATVSQQLTYGHYVELLSMNDINEIKYEITKKIKDYSKNRSDLTTYYNVGKMLSEAVKHYGERIIKEYSKKLTNELGKGYTFTSLTRIKKFYNLIEKLATVSQQLTYGHYVELLSMNDINEIKYEITKKIKDYSKNRSDLTTYYNVGKMLSEAVKHYGERIIKEYSKKLTNELGKGYTETKLKYFRQFYIFSKSHTVCDELTWSHYRMLLSINDENKI